MVYFYRVIERYLVFNLIYLLINDGITNLGATISRACFAKNYLGLFVRFILAVIERIYYFSICGKAID
jgi:hypothetical protein